MRPLPPRPLGFARAAGIESAPQMNATVTRRVRTTLALAIVALGVGACGAGGNGAGAGSGATVALPSTESPIYQSLVAGHFGRTLQVLNQSGFTHLDPGQVDDSRDEQVVSATQRTLYAYLPNNPRDPVPDLAAGAPQISANRMTVTVHLKPGIHFSPPVDREITAADVAYAFDRALNPDVANPYVHEYFGDLIGVQRARGGPFPGVTTPNRYTIVFHLDRPTAPIVAAALVLPITSPVPPEFARPLDAHDPTLYGSQYLVATGPYMLRANGLGQVLGIGYVPGRFAELVRNPNWDPRTDFRPAYVNAIDVRIGGNPAAIGRAVIDGSARVQNDAPAASVVQAANAEVSNANTTTNANQPQPVLTVAPGTGVRLIALNNKRGPFANVNLRRALWAALDREALVAAGGGPFTGQVATHFLYPGTPGFYQAGGNAGPQFDFNRSLTGDDDVAEKYLKLAGYSSGRYRGPPVSVVGPAGQPGASFTAIVNRTLIGLGFPTRVRLVSASVGLSRYCGVPAQEVEVCPDVGWTRAFADPQTVLDPLFNGASITRQDNTNVGQVNDPEINRQMDAAALVAGADARAQAWADIDVELVGQAVAIPFMFTDQPALASPDVAGVTAQWNGGWWDYTFTSIIPPKTGS